MTRGAVVAVLIAVACLLAAGGAASSLERAVSTTPDDAVDIRASWVVVGTPEDVRALEAVMQEPPTDPRDDAPPVREPPVRDVRVDTPPDLDRAGDARGDPGEDVSTRGIDTLAHERAPSAPGRDAARRRGGSGVEAPDSAGAASETRDELTLTRPPSLEQSAPATDPRTGPSRSLLSPLGLLGALAAGATVARTGIRPRFGTLTDTSRESEAATGGVGSVRRPRDPVAGAFHELVARLDLEDGATRTPREVGAAAVEAGFEAESVTRLTRTFEEVRYGGASVTDRRRRAARNEIRRLRGQVPDR